MEKAVVTEALGIIGFHLCQRLLEEGVEVLAIDDLSDKRDKEERLHYFGRNALFSFLDREKNNFSFDEVIKGSDVYFHLTDASPDCLTQELQGQIDDVVDKLFVAAETSASHDTHCDTPIQLKCCIVY